MFINSSLGYRNLNPKSTDLKASEEDKKDLLKEKKASVKETTVLPSGEEPEAIVLAGDITATYMKAMVPGLTPPKGTEEEVASDDEPINPSLKPASRLDGTYDELVARYEAGEYGDDYHAQLALLRDIIGLAEGDNKIKWITERVKVMQAHMLDEIMDAINNYNGDPDSVADLLRPWEDLFAGDVVEEGYFSGAKPDDWNVLIDYYNQNYTNTNNAMIYGIIDANIQSWEVVYAAIKLKLLTMDPDDPDFKKLERFITNEYSPTYPWYGVQQNIDEWTEALQGYPKPNP